MSLPHDDFDELDASFAQLLDDECTDVTPRFQLPDAAPTRPPPLPPADDSLEFDLRTPSRWSELPQLRCASVIARSTVTARRLRRDRPSRRRASGA